MYRLESALVRPDEIRVNHFFAAPGRTSPLSKRIENKTRSFHVRFIEPIWAPLIGKTQIVRRAQDDSMRAIILHLQPVNRTMPSNP